MTTDFDTTRRNRREGIFCHNFAELRSPVKPVKSEKPKGEAREFHSYRARREFENTWLQSKMDSLQIS